MAIDPSVTPNVEPPRRPALEPPQFTLATLLWVVAALGGLFAAMTAAGPIGGFALLLLVLAIVAHVAGNSLGTRLRSFGSAPGDETDPDRAGKHQGDPRLASAPASSLSRRSSFTATMIVFTASGAAFLGTGGSALLIGLTWGQLNLPTVVVAVVSPTVLGGLLGFAISSFTQTAGGAWWEASRSHRRVAPQQSSGSPASTTQSPGTGSRQKLA